MNKLTENIIEMSMFFFRMLEDDKIKQPEPDTVSVCDEFKNKVEDWANEFEKMYRNGIPYLDAIEVFLLKKFIENGWAEVEDKEGNLEEFGYTNGDMIFLSRIDAAYRYMFEDKSVFMIHPDNISVQVCCMEDISKHMDNGGLFGYKNPYQEIQFVMNDRFYEDGWAEPYLIRAKASKDASYIVLELQKIVNRIVKEDELPCGLEGIEKIVKIFQQEHPDVIKDYEAVYIPGVCFGYKAFPVN